MCFGRALYYPTNTKYGVAVWIHNGKHCKGVVAMRNSGAAIASLTVPLDLPDSALAQRTFAALAPFYREFQGFEVSRKVIDEEVQMMLSRTY